MRARLLVALLASLLVMGCTVDPAACPEGTFRCIDACLPFGSVCGDAGVRDSGSIDANAIDTSPIDAGASDTPVDDPCVADDGTPIDRVCLSDDVVRDCRDGTEASCRSDQHCEPFRLGGRMQASCYLDGSAPCDLSSEPPAQCSGSVITTCDDRGGPVPERNTLDCRALLGWPDATCAAAGDGFRCVAPQSTACDPEPDAPTCDDDLRVWCRGGLSFVDGAVWVREDCGPALACFASRIDGRGVCLGADATPSTIAPGEIAQRCTDETTVRVRSEGYTYDLPCPLVSHFTPDGEVTEQGICVVDGVDGYRCERPGDVESCAPGSAPVCAAPGAGPVDAARPCVAQGDGRDVRATRPCLIPFEDGFAASTCEAGVCDHVGACETSDPPACVSGLLVRCDPTRLVWTASFCAEGCMDGACN